ncbi:MAG: hypothetical protein ABI614_08050 [Planctomycetota bacterium]
MQHRGQRSQIEIGFTTPMTVARSTPQQRQGDDAIGRDLLAAFEVANLLAVRDPAANQIDLLRRKLFFLGRHLARRNQLEHPAGVWLAGGHHRPRFATCHHRLHVQNLETALRIVSTVTTRTARLENRQHVRFELRHRFAATRVTCGEKDRRCRVDRKVSRLCVHRLILTERRANVRAKGGWGRVFEPPYASS